MKLKALLLAVLATLLSATSFSRFAFAESPSVRDDGIPYTLYFDANGGIDAPAPVIDTGFERYAIIRIPDTTPSRAGFVFAGWSKSPAGPAQYFSGDYVTFTSRESIIYATWTEEKPLVTSTDESHLVEGNTEPLGEMSSSSRSQSKSLMYSGASLVALIFGIIFIMALSASGTFLVYRRIMDYKE